MKKITSETILRTMEIALFALLIADAYLNHKEEIDESVSRFKEIIKKKGDCSNGEQTAEN